MPLTRTRSHLLLIISLLVLSLTPIYIDAATKPSTSSPSKATLKKDYSNAEQVEKEIVALMTKLKGDRFSDATGTTLQHLIETESTSATTATSTKSFIHHLFLAFWSLHHHEIEITSEIFDEMTSYAPTSTLIHVCELWSSLLHNWNQLLTNQHLIQYQLERDTLAIARQLIIIAEPLTENNEKIEWKWEQLIHIEAKWVIAQLPDHANPGNKKCLYVPGLLAKEFYNNTNFYAAGLLEEKYHMIMEELRPFLSHAESSFNNVGSVTAETDANLVLQGQWQDISLFSAGAKNNEVCKRLKKLCTLLEQEIPEVTRNVQGHALLSRLSAGTIVNRHHGYSNNQLTLHLGLLVPTSIEYPNLDIDIGIEVNQIKSTWKQGKVIVFDDSFYHSVWYKYSNKDPSAPPPSSPPSSRLVLLLRFLHPEYTLLERAHLVMTHTETPWTIQQRIDEMHHLMYHENVKNRWEREKERLRQGEKQVEVDENVEVDEHDEHEEHEEMEGHDEL